MNDINKIRDYIIEYLEREYSLPDDVDYDKFNYIESGYVDSMGLIQFVVMLEDEFSISFSDDDLKSENFKTINGLTNLINEKIIKNK